MKKDSKKKKRSAKKKVNPLNVIAIMLLLLIAVLVVILIMTLHGNSITGVTSTESTAPDTTVDMPTGEFLVSPTNEIEVEVSEDGRNITLHVLPDTETLDFGSLVTAQGTWTISDASGKLCENDILPITKDGETFTVLYGMNTIYRVTVKYQVYYTVKFEGLLSQLSVRQGEKVSAPEETPEKTGHTFAGWDFNFDAPVNESLTVSAKWTPNSYKITYEPNGGTVELFSMNVTYGTTFDHPIPKKEGFTFIGWYNNDTQIPSGTWNYESNMTLVAKWDMHDYLITYDPNGGYVDQTLQGVSFGEAFEPPVPKRAGYSFLGWFVDGKPIDSTSYSYNKDMVFVAEWSENRYVVNYVTNGGGELVGGEMSLSEIQSQLPTREGYTFGGWFFNAALDSNDVIIGDDGTVTAYAWWKEENKAADFDFEITSDGVTITGFHSYRAVCVIPSFIGGKPVVALGDSAFAGCSSLTKLMMPASVVTIGSETFAGAVNLEKINPVENTANDMMINLAGITSIGSGAFRDCGFDRIVLPESVTYLADELFADCENLAYVTLSHITSVGKGVFKGCTSLASIALPAEILIIGDDFFRGCTSLTDVTLPSGLEVLGDAVFAGCTSLKNVRLPDAINRIGDSLFDGCNSLETIENLTENTRILTIGSRAFADCTKLSGVGIPASVTAIGAEAFLNCLEVKSLVLPDRVSVIENGTFSGCAYLSTLSVMGDITKIGDNAFNGCRRLSAINLTSKLTSVGESAFMNCMNLTSVSLTQSLEYLGKKAFAGCSRLSTMTISRNLTEIPEGAFEGCTALITLTWHDAITTIGDRAFYDCRAFSPNDIPEALETIGSEAFRGCVSIQTLRFEKTLTSLGSLAFADCISLTEVIYGGSAERWKGIAATDAFDGCTDLRGNISVVEGVVDDLSSSFVRDDTTGALWTIDSTLDMNGKRPAALIQFRSDSVYYNNLITEGKISSGYVWKLVLEGETADFTFSMTVTVSNFEIIVSETYITIVMDLGERFATMTDLAVCSATLEIYSADDPDTVLYRTALGKLQLTDK